MARYAIGDVHGCARTLAALVARIAPAPDDHLVFLGDYIDRGPDTPGVIDFLIDLTGRTRCTFLRGNHDQLMLDALAGLRGAAYDAWIARNGGDATMRQYGARGGVPDAHAAFLRDTLLAFDAPEAAYVHAGLDPHRSVAEQMAAPDEETLLWSRDHLRVRPSTVVWEKPVVFGHTPRPEPLIAAPLIGLDTGCVYGPTRPDLGRLCALRMDDATVFLEPYRG